MATRAQIVNVIASRMQEYYRFASWGLTPEELRDDVERANDEGWSVDVPANDYPRRWTRVEGVVLDDAEIEAVVSAATGEPDRPAALQSRKSR